MHLTPASLSLLLALMLPGVLHAAEEPEAAEAEAEEQTDSTSAEPTETRDADTASEDPIVTEAAEAGTAPTQSEDDSFVPTVQISEDLSVSFPADI